MHIQLISASMRAESESLKVARYLEARIKAHGHTAEILDLYTIKLPNYDDSDDPLQLEAKQWIRERLTAAEAYVFISPEWAGAMSYGLINMLLFVGKEMADKPVLLTGVSDTRGGFYPIAQMQQIGQKNRHYVLLPEHLVLSSIKEFMNDPTTEPEAYVEKRADYALRVLETYAEALVHVRQSGVTDYVTYKNGM